MKHHAAHVRLWICICDINRSMTCWKKAIIWKAWSHLIFKKRKNMNKHREVCEAKSQNGSRGYFLLVGLWVILFFLFYIFWQWASVTFTIRKAIKHSEKRINYIKWRTGEADHWQMRETETWAQLSVLKWAHPARSWQWAICEGHSAARQQFISRPASPSHLRPSLHQPQTDFERPSNTFYLKGNNEGAPEHPRV